MGKYLDLLATLESLEAERTRIRNEGEALFDCWISSFTPAGTARTSNSYLQLRTSKPMSNGKKSKYLKAGEVAHYRAAIARGKQLRQLEKEINALRAKL